MENEYQEELSFDFLSADKTVKYFADLNMKLLAGKHIQAEDYHLFTLLEERFDAFHFFYEKLYQLNLVKDTHDNIQYYYLNFYDTGKGKLADGTRHRELTMLQTIVGLVLMNMYYTKYFESPKLINWSEIKQEIEQGELRVLYKKAFFGGDKTEIADFEWSRVEKNWKNTINSFQEFGWVKRLSGPNEEIQFEISPAIHRFATLYKQELEDFPAFISRIQTTTEEE